MCIFSQWKSIYLFGCEWLKSSFARACLIFDTGWQSSRCNSYIKPVLTSDGQAKERFQSWHVAGFNLGDLTRSMLYLRLLTALKRQNSFTNNKMLDSSRLKAFVEGNRYDSETEICLGRVSWQRRKCWLPAFSHYVFKRLLSQSHLRA